MRAGQAAYKVDQKHPFTTTQPMLVQTLVALAFARHLRVGTAENDRDTPT